jgi:hypothetical protein
MRAVMNGEASVMVEMWCAPASAEPIVERLVANKAEQQALSRPLAAERGRRSPAFTRSRRSETRWAIRSSRR